MINNFVADREVAYIILGLGLTFGLWAAIGQILHYFGIQIDFSKRKVK